MRRWFASLPLLVLIALPVGAQQEAGDFEIQLGGSFHSVMGQDDVSTTTGILLAKGGYFLTDRVEVGAFPSLTFVRTTFRDASWAGGDEETVSDTKLGLGAFVTYSFLAADARTVPYLGGQFYRIDVTDEDEVGWIGGKGGFKYYLNPRAAFDVGGNLLFGLGDAGGTLLLFQFGLSFLL